MRGQGALLLQRRALRFKNVVSVGQIHVETVNLRGNNTCHGMYLAAISNHTYVHLVTLRFTVAQHMLGLALPALVASA